MTLRTLSRDVFTLLYCTVIKVVRLERNFLRKLVLKRLISIKFVEEFDTALIM